MAAAVVGLETEEQGPVRLADCKQEIAEVAVVRSADCSLDTACRIAGAGPGLVLEKLDTQLVAEDTVNTSGLLVVGHLDRAVAEPGPLVDGQMMKKQCCQVCRNVPLQEHWEAQ